MSEELDPGKNYDATFLFLRADERVQSVEAEQHDIEVQFHDHKNEVAEKFRDQNARIEYLIGRMDNQVSKTGKENTAAIAALDKKMDRIDSQLFDKETGLITQFTGTRDWQANFNKTVIGVFLIGGIVSGLAWFLKHF